MARLREFVSAATELMCYTHKLLGDTSKTNCMICRLGVPALRCVSQCSFTGAAGVSRDLAVMSTEVGSDLFQPLWHCEKDQKEKNKTKKKGKKKLREKKKNNKRDEENG